MLRLKPNLRIFKPLSPEKRCLFTTNSCSSHVRNTCTVFRRRSRLQAQKIVASGVSHQGMFLIPGRGKSTFAHSTSFSTFQRLREQISTRSSFSRLPKFQRRLLLFVGVPYGLLSIIPISFTGLALFHKLKGSPSETVRGYSFFATTGFLSIPLSVVLFASSPFVLLFDWDQRLFFNSIQHVWGSLTCYPFLRPTVVGMEKLPSVGGQPVVYVSNHQSWLDILTCYFGLAYQ